MGVRKRAKPLSKKRRELIEQVAAIADKSLDEFDDLVAPEDVASTGRATGLEDARVFAQRRKAVELLLSYGNTLADISVAMEVKFGMQYVQTQRLVIATERRWEESEKVSTIRRKQMAETRILADKQRAQRDGAHGAVMTAEQLLMKLQGTEAPRRIEVQVDVAERTLQALGRAFSALSPARMRALSLAGQARTALLQSPQVIEAEATTEDSS